MLRRTAAVGGLLLLVAWFGGGPAGAQTLLTTTTAPISLTPTASCPQAAIAELQKTISFVRSQSWAEHPGSQALMIVPDAAACRVKLQLNQLTSKEEAVLRAGAGPRLYIQRVADHSRPSRWPLLLWLVFGGAGVVFVINRYGRR